MLLEAILFLVLIGYLFHKYFLSQGKPPSWWKKYRVLEIDASSVASQYDILLGRKSITLRDDYAYQAMGSSNKFCGMLESPTPIILVKDLDLLKKITIKDFDHFVNRRDFFTVPNKEHVSGRFMGFLKGEEWKQVRSTVSPTFTTGKIRRMMNLCTSVGKEWVEMLKSKAESSASGSAEVDIQSCVNQYAMEMIGTTAFGINTGSVKNAQSPFAIMANRFLGTGPIDLLKQNLSPRFPALFQFFNINPFDETATQFFENIVKKSLAERMKTKDLSRNDFQQLLLEARIGDVKALGSDELDDFEKDALIKGGNMSQKDKKQLLTDKLIIGQAVMFFIAGFMGTSSFIGFVAYALAIYPEIQKKLRKEVDQIVKEDGSMDYDELLNLAYLEMVCSETLRRFPPILRMERVSQRDYHDPDSGLFVPKDTVLVVPINAIHHDPKYYERPDEFYPEHFSSENKSKRNPYAFIPFGLGPRNCIGMRFALMESKAAVAYLVHNFFIEPTKKTPIKMEALKAGVFAFTPKDLELKLTPI